MYECTQLYPGGVLSGKIHFTVCFRSLVPYIRITTAVLRFRYILYIHTEGITVTWKTNKGRWTTSTNSCWGTGLTTPKMHTVQEQTASSHPRYSSCHSSLLWWESYLGEGTAWASLPSPCLWWPMCTGTCCSAPWTSHCPCSSWFWQLKNQSKRRKEM